MNGEAWWYVAAAVGHVFVGWAAVLIVWKARERFLAVCVAAVFFQVVARCVGYALKAAGGQ